MLKVFRKQRYLLIGFLILFSAFRIYFLNFPSFTTDETQISFRGCTLASEGKDELGRTYPVIFNSQTDYQLPITSYVTALGIRIFGKNDLGARSPFIVLGIGLILLTFLISQLFSKKLKFRFLSTVLIGFSYSCIFLSGIPNETIILTFLLLLLFYLLTLKINSKYSLFLIAFCVIISILTSKFAWFILAPFVANTLYFYKKDLNVKTKFQIIGFTLLSCVLALVIFLAIPQAKRSLMENNLSLISNITIENGINRLRGQGIESGWPNFLEKILFNKIHFLVDGGLHWISQLQPKSYFGQLDETGVLNFSQKGIFSKFLIIPFFMGLVYLVQKGTKAERGLFVYLLLLTFPAAFVYPSFSPQLISLTLPFATIIIALGFTYLNKKISTVILFLVLLELMVSILSISQENKLTYNVRPLWVKEITQDTYQQSLISQTAISDDISEDIVNFVEWYNPVEIAQPNLHIPYPYKFRQTNLKNIKITGYDSKIYFCLDKTYKQIIIGKRDKDRIKDMEIKISKIYKDELGVEIAYLIENDVCIK